MPNFSLLTLLLLICFNLLAQETPAPNREDKKIIEKDLDRTEAVDENIVFKSIMHNSEEMQKINKEVEATGQKVEETSRQIEETCRKIEVPLFVTFFIAFSHMALSLLL